MAARTRTTVAAGNWTTGMMPDSLDQTGGMACRGGTYGAEEIVIQVPDGRRMTTIVNSTPIPSEEGAVETVVVTLQDMTPPGGAGTAAGRVPGHGEPQTAGAVDFHQGFRRRRAAGLLHAGHRRDSSVLPHHRRPGRGHALHDRRSAGRGAHRDGLAAGGSRTV